MIQDPLILSCNLTQAERRASIREAFLCDRSQMTLMLAHRLQITEVEILRALEGDLARELDAAGRTSFVPSKHWATYTSFYRTEQALSRFTVSSVNSRTQMTS
jgi:hypothetical protein